MDRSALVDAYLETLGLARGAPEFAFLRELTARHVRTFPFSSMGVQLGDRLPLDFESLFDRIVVRRRGGYCFEQNGLFYGVLEELGFSPELYLARVINNQDIHPGLTHRISMITHADQRYVVDVGFGPYGPRVPVAFSETETHDGAKVFRIVEHLPGEFHMQNLRDGNFFSMYRFELSRYGQADCELGHFFSHRHPDATFVNRLVASLILDSEIRSLFETGYWIITDTGNREQVIENTDQLRQILVDEFGLHIDGEESRRLFSKLKSR